MASTRDSVVQILHEVTGLLDGHDRAREVLAGRDIALERLDIDSLTWFEIISQLEDAHALELEPTEMQALTSLDGLVAHVEEALRTRDG